MADLYPYFKPFLPWAYLAVALAAPMAVLAYFGTGRDFFGPRRRRAVPWAGAEVLAAFFLYLAIPIGAAIFLYKIDAFVYGPEAADNPIAKMRCTFWGSVLASPFQVGLVLLLLQRTSDTQTYQLGWTGHRAVPNVVAGYLCWLVLMPCILLLYQSVGALYERWLHVVPEPHGIQELMTKGPTATDWVLTLLAAIVAAPLTEELLYRGVVQRWSTCETYRSDIVFIMCFVPAIVLRGVGLEKALKTQAWLDLALELQPVFLILALVPVYLLIRRSFHSPAAPGIFSSALLFAMSHAFAWPSPIPLLPLGLVLGYLAHRTQSLVGPIALHALFNSVAVLGLLYQDTVPTEPANGKPTTSAVRPVPSTSSFVPGESCPRRT